MVAKRNVEVERLNATARELVRSEGRLGSGGDRGRRRRLRRRRSGHHPRQRPRRRHLQPRALGGRRRSTPSAGASSLTASTRPGASRSAATTSTRTTLGGEAPALQHAYAVTTYCAQGTTVDRAYVMVDPLDGQAGDLRRHLAHPRADLPLRDAGDPGRARRSTRRPVPSATPIAHVGEAAERDRAQTAAHDEALRAELAKLPTRGDRGEAQASWIPRPASRPATRRATPASAEAVRDRARRRSSRPSPTAKPSKRSAGASAARSCPTPRKRASYCANGWPRRRGEAGADGAAEQRGPARARDCRSASRRALGASARRRPDRATRLHRQGAGAEASRSGQGRGLGSRRPGQSSATGSNTA